MVWSMWTVIRACSFLWILLFHFSFVEGQICNTMDPESGGLIIPAFSSGGAKATLPNGSKVNHCIRNELTPWTYKYGCEPAKIDPQPMAIVYLILLGYCFLGVSLLSDVFMSSILLIASKTKIVRSYSPSGKLVQREVVVWNMTVANLTLMALGTSAPEILLSVIEILTSNFYIGELGVGTIVGSAAFNLLCITAVCMWCIPQADHSIGENGLRRVEGFNVFLLTTFFSMGAYAWLLIMLVVISPDIVEDWEAAVTFVLYFILVWVAWKTDVVYDQPRLALGKYDSIEMNDMQQEKKNDNQHRVNISNINNPNIERTFLPHQQIDNRKLLSWTRNKYTAEEVSELLKGEDLAGMSDKEKHDLIAYYEFKKSKQYWLFYSIAAIRLYLSGRPSPIPQRPFVRERETNEQELPNDLKNMVTLAFQSSSYTVFEDEGDVRAIVNLIGDTTSTVTVEYMLIGVTAQEGEDFISERKLVARPKKRNQMDNVLIAFGFLAFLLLGATRIKKSSTISISTFMSLVVGAITLIMAGYGEAASMVHSISQKKNFW